HGLFEVSDWTDEAHEGGGCMIADPFTDPYSEHGRGVDCSAVSHVEDVACVSGTCAVRSCQVGWTVNREGIGC
ncbi:hypothetical protein BV20DRAFT_928570, partial [Pilatotrama ljubarskyi]